LERERTLIPPLGEPFADFISLVIRWRWQAGTVDSKLKRLLGSALRARNDWSPCRKTILRAISLNVLILKRKQVFDGADLFPVSARVTN
jgi:hypothetical protein